MRSHQQLAAAAVVVVGLLGLAVAEDMKNPLADAKAGEWARYKMQGGMEMKQIVSKVEGKKVTLKTEMFMEGKVVSSSEAVVDLEPKTDPATPATPAEKPVIEDATVEVNGKKLACKVMTVAGSKTTTCMDIPVTGLVKVESGGNVSMELVDWGTDAKAGGAEAPKGDAPAGEAPKPAEGAAPAADAGGKTKTVDDVTVTVTDAGPMKTDSGTVVKGFHSFKVTVKNGADDKRSVKGKITLNGGDSGSCTIFIPVEKGATVEKVLNCKETAAWDKWDMEVEKIFKF